MSLRSITEINRLNKEKKTRSLPKREFSETRPFMHLSKHVWESITSEILEL